MILKNVTDGPKGVNTMAGPIVIPPGQQAEVDISEIEATASLGTGWFEEVEAELASESEATPHPLDHDGDGRKGGSRSRRTATKD